MTRSTDPEVLSAYFATMRQFLATQSRVMSSFLGTQPAGTDLPALPAEMPMGMPADMPAPLAAAASTANASALARCRKRSPDPMPRRRRGRRWSATRWPAPSR